MVQPTSGRRVLVVRERRLTHFKNEVAHHDPAAPTPTARSGASSANSNPEAHTAPEPPPFVGVTPHSSAARGLHPQTGTGVCPPLEVI